MKREGECDHEEGFGVQYTVGRRVFVFVYFASDRNPP